MQISILIAIDFDRAKRLMNEWRDQHKNLIMWSEMLRTRRCHSPNEQLALWPLGALRGERFGAQLHWQSWCSWAGYSKTQTQYHPSSWKHCSWAPWNAIVKHLNKLQVVPLPWNVYLLLIKLLSQQLRAMQAPLSTKPQRQPGSGALGRIVTAPALHRMQ